MALKKQLFSLMFCPFLLWSCADKDNGPSPKPDRSVDYSKPESQGYITVLSEKGTPISGAKILIGSALNKPFTGNFLTTDSKGQVMKPAAWSSTEPITVSAPGHVRVTHFSRKPGGATFRLRQVSRQPNLAISGQTTGHSVKDNDGYMDVGLVMAAMSRNDILAFDLTKVMSNRMDKITVMGQSIDVPSNITLPRQRENYILPIRLEKPNYRLFFSEEGSQKVFAAQGRFPFRQMIDELRKGTPFYDLINAFQITGGVIREVNVRNGVKEDLPVNALTFNTRRTLRAPALRGKEVMISMAVADINGWLVPSDVKKLTSNESRAMALMGVGTPMALGVLKNSDEFEDKGVDRISATLLPFTEGVTPAFLPLIQDPRVMGNGELILDRPNQAPAKVNALATVAIFSEIQQMSIGNGKSLSTLNRIWEVYAPQWVDRMNLPIWPEGTPNPLKKRWEVAYIGSETKTQADLGQAVIDAATHVTHSSTDF